jgi:hypothetical protein
LRGKNDGGKNKAKNTRFGADWRLAIPHPQSL